jgi:histone acetyltransferase
VSAADFPVLIARQRAAVQEKIRDMTASHIVHPGIPAFLAAPSREVLPARVHKPVPLESIPGLKESGWTRRELRFRLVLPQCGAGAPTRENLHRFMSAIQVVVCEHADAWPFMEPVDPRDVPDYRDIVKEPVDLKMISDRIASGDHYLALEMFAADFRRMFNNCRLYNAPDTPYFKCANRLESFFEQKVASSISWKQMKA